MTNQEVTNSVSAVDYNQFTAKEISTLIIALQELEESGARLTKREQWAILRSLDAKKIGPVAVLLKAAGYCDKTPTISNPLAPLFGAKG